MILILFISAKPLCNVWTVLKCIKEKRGTRSCNKKMEPHGDLWQCAAGHESSHPMARWMCQFIACDHTGSQYIASFDEVSWQKLTPEATQSEI